MEKKYVTGNLDYNAWRQNESQQLTFVVTQDCNLRCKYCYMVDKNDKNIMNYTVAKQIVDYFVDNKENLFTVDYVVLDFIGGEPLLEIELIDKIVDYFRLTTYKKKSTWFGRFRIMIQSNGVLVDSEEFQRFLRKNKGLVSLGITIDGIKEKHDLQRVFPNGEGSYSIVEKNYKMAMEKGITRSTKVTFGHEDLKYIKDSIIHLWSMGIEDVPANIVFEDVWEEGDDIIYEEQLLLLADYIIDNHLWDKYNTSLFYDELGFKATDDVLMNAVCGTGSMYCVDAKGDIYNCVRFMSYSLENKEDKKIGDIYNGVDVDKVRPLQTLLTKYISDEKCLNCRIDHNCAYCAGYNYDASDNDSLFYRSTAICDMHKARVKANNYFWARLYNEHSISRKVKFSNEFFMYFILSSESVDYCDFKSLDTKEVMKPEDLIQGLAYAYNNFYQPVFVHSNESVQWLNDLLSSEQYGKALSFEMKRHIIKHIMRYQKNDTHKNVIYVMDERSDRPEIDLNVPIILNVSKKNVNKLTDMVNDILPFTSRISINLKDVDKNFDIIEYEKQLDNLIELIFNYFSNGEQKEIRQLTDRIVLQKMNNCFAGEKNITMAPDGKFYYCPAFYFDKTKNIDFDKSYKLTYLSKSPACDNCDVYHCERCIYKNYTGTGELNTPTKMQCTISHLERKYSTKLLEKLKEKGVRGFKNFNIPEIDYNDPLEKIAERTYLKATSK